jgi:hypothetical protein
MRDRLLLRAPARVHNAMRQWRVDASGEIGNA